MERINVYNLDTRILLWDNIEHFYGIELISIRTVRVIPVKTTKKVSYRVDKKVIVSVVIIVPVDPKRIL